MHIRCLFAGLILALSVLQSTPTFAAFSLAGTTITQSGTDTDLSGLASIAGVTTETNGSGNAVFNSYFVGNVKLIITGDLTIDPTNEMLVFGTTTPNQTLDVASGGVLNFGQEITVNGLVYQTRGTGMIIPDATNAACCGGESFIVRSGGTLNWNGATLQIAGGLQWLNGSTVNIKNGVLEATRGSLFRLRQYSQALNVDGFTTYGSLSIDWFASPVSFTGYNPQASARASEVVGASSGGTNAPYVFDNYNSAGMVLDFSVWQGSDLQFNNIELETDPICSINAGADGLVQIFKDFNLNVFDTSNIPIQDAKFYFTDTDNGNRFNKIPRSGTDYDLASTKTYFGNSDANGSFPLTKVLTRVGYNNSGGIANWDYRSENNGLDDKFTFNIINYNKTISQSAQNLNGSNVLEVNWILIEDNAISENAKATVDAYTEINSLERLYDRAKAHLVDNYAGETELIISGSGNEINAGIYDIVVDNTATQAFAFDGSTINIKANTMDCTGDKFTSLTTTGSITFINGAQAGTCIFNDNVGTNGILTLTGLNNANVLVYDDQAVNDPTVYFQTGQSGDISIPFSATGSTDYQVVVRRTGYSEQNFEFNPSTGGFFEFPISQTQALTIEGTAIYQNSGDLAKISIDAPNLKINLGDFTLNGQELYDTLQDIEVTEAAMKFPRIANFDGKTKILLLNGYQIRNRDGAVTVPGINAFVFTASGGILDSTNGSVQFLTDSTATVDKQDQIVKMLEAIQGSPWDNVNEVFTLPNANLVGITGTGFDSLTDSLSSLIDSMFDRGILDINTAKDLMQ